MDSSFLSEVVDDHITIGDCPARDFVTVWFNTLVGALFPGFSDVHFKTEDEFQDYLKKSEQDLTDIFRCIHDAPTDHKKLAQDFMNDLPDIRNQLLKDRQAIFDGDPAARSLLEVTRSYPGFYAIAAHRIAHRIFELEIDLIPRIISENAHSITGIDIHPGAQIGDYFCIDHGTGIVIGETTQIGNHVKIYQGVTLGALSVDKKDARSKRHPTIGDHVVLYAGATILGGNTLIGEHSVIGGNVWITRSVESHQKIYYKAKMTNEDGDSDTITYKF